MRTIFRLLFTNMIALALLSYFLPGISFQNSLLTLLLAALALGLINVTIRPLLKVMLLPINIITFGLLSWLVNAIILFLVTLFVPEFTVSTTTIGPILIAGISIPKITLSAFWVYISASFLLSLISSFFAWLL